MSDTKQPLGYSRVELNERYREFKLLLIQYRGALSSTSVVVGPRSTVLRGAKSKKQRATSRR